MGLRVGRRVPREQKMLKGLFALQEQFCGDVWTLLLSCILMGRVSSAEVELMT